MQQAAKPQSTAASYQPHHKERQLICYFLVKHHIIDTFNEELHEFREVIWVWRDNKDFVQSAKKKKWQVFEKTSI